MSRLLLAALLAAAPHAPAPRVEGWKGVENVGRVSEGFFRGSTPTEEGLDTLKARGIRTVVNLRHYHGSREEEGCRKRGLDYVRIVLESSDAPSEEDVRAFLALVGDPARRPVYVHCWRGKDRTGAMVAAYRMAVEGWTLREALAEMDAFGFYLGWRDLRAFVESFAPRAPQVRPSPTP